MTTSSNLRSAEPVIRLPRHSAVVPDWSREECSRFWHPSRKLLRALRDYTSAREQGGVRGYVGAKVAAARHRFWSVISGADIPLNAGSIAGGLLMPHPNGIVIHPASQIGPNCLLFQQVTLGTGPKPGTPRLGGHVDVGAGAKILGGVVIGDHAVIGANAVVVTDVPAWGVAVGVPAVVRVMAHDGAGSALDRAG
jgi:serine O-acetyltransferase